MAMTRRQFLKRASASAAAMSLGPNFKWLPGTKVSYASGLPGPIVIFVQLYGGNDGINTVYPISGPQRVKYDTYRPTLGLPADPLLLAARASAAGFGATSALDLGSNSNGSNYALHPAMEAMHGLYTAGKLAVLPGVHYPYADHSHFRSEIIWYTADPQGSANQGWFGKYLNLSPSNFIATNVPGIMLGDSLNPVFTPTTTSLLAFNRLSELRFPADGELALKQTAFTDLYDLSDDLDPGTFPELVSIGRTGFATVQKINEYFQPGSPPGKVEALLVDGNGDYDQNNPLIYSSPLNESDNPNIAGMDLARDLKHVAATIRADVGARFFHVAIGGFDTHSNQEKDFYHSTLLREVSESIAAFYGEISQSVSLPGSYTGYRAGDLSAANPGVLLMTFSEFGRTIRQNAPGATSAGTDHATSIPVFVVGGTVVGGQQYGAYPLLENGGDNEDDLLVSTDFRDVFGTILTRWLDIAPANIHTILPQTTLPDDLGQSWTTFLPLGFLP